MLKSKRAVATAVSILTAGTAFLSTTTPALATFYGNTQTVGHILPASYGTHCDAGGSGFCYIELGNPTGEARPPSSVDVYNCPGVENGTSYLIVLGDHAIDYRHVSILWGGTGAVGAVDCIA